MRRCDITGTVKPSARIHYVNWKMPFDSLTPAAQQQLLDERQGSLNCSLQALFRRRYRLISLPPGTFTLRFTSNATDDRTALDELLEPIAREAIPVPAYSPLIVHFEGFDTLYFRSELLRAMARHYEEHWLLRLLAEFAEKWERHEVPATDLKVRKYIPYDDRKKRPNGAVMRGNNWSAFEDGILKRYFGVDERGVHRLCSPERWEMLLAEFNGERSKKAILGRICVLNHQLKLSLLVDGFIPKKNLSVYLKRKLGQRQRLPNNRPRPDGTYYPTKKPKPEPMGEFLPSRPNNIAAAEAAATEDAVCLVNN